MASDVNTSPSGPGSGSGPSPSGSVSHFQQDTSKLESPSTPSNINIKNNTQAQPQTQQSSLYLSANFASDPKTPFAVNYDQEVYLQLMAEEEGAGRTKKNKTPTQIYREKWVRRALNPAISDPRGDPSAIDLEAAESQREKDRF